MAAALAKRLPPKVLHTLQRRAGQRSHKVSPAQSPSAHHHQRHQHLFSANSCSGDSETWSRAAAGLHQETADTPLVRELVTPSSSAASSMPTSPTRSAATGTAALEPCVQQAASSLQLGQRTSSITSSVTSATSTRSRRQRRPARGSHAQAGSRPSGRPKQLGRIVVVHGGGLVQSLGARAGGGLGAAPPAAPVGAAASGGALFPTVDEEGDTCPVCLDAPPLIKTKPCDHTLCLDCARDLCMRHCLIPALCPYCRVIITGFHAA